ncbi:MAG TPA: heparinase II/III family protein, partial [Planctomycetota bacterium]|nr:heparinase II/III family protein [Planctomycetota bacterium]
SYYMHGGAWLETDSPGPVLQKAKDLLNDVFFNSWAPHQVMNLKTGGADPDWKSGLSKAGTSLGRNTFVAELGTAFSLTGDAAYARKCVELMRSYVRCQPFILDDRFFQDHDMYFGGDSNHTLTVTYRMFRWTDFLHSGACHALGVLKDEDVFWIIKNLWFYSMQFYRLCNDEMRRDNHHLVDHGHAQFVMGTIFPEFAAGPEMAASGAKVIRYHFGHNLLKDGGYVEHSGEYQYHIIYHFLHPYALAQANDIKLLSASDVERLRSWVEFNAHVCKPDGMIAGIGDSPGRPLAYFFSTLAAPVMTPKLVAMARALGFAAGETITSSMGDIAKRMQDWQPGTPPNVGISGHYRKEEGKSAKASAQPKETSKQYPLSGYTFFRSDWTPNADYLAFSHMTKHSIGGHAHWDMNSFVLHTRGKTLIGDPAANLYLDKRFSNPDGSLLGPGQEDKGYHRGYSYSMNAHNCLIMNDDFLKPLLAMSHPTFWGGNPPRCEAGLFAPGENIEIAEASHDGNDPTRHTRYVVHLRGIGFVLVDKIWRNVLDMRPNNYAQYFHMEGDVEIAPQEPTNGGNLRVFSGEASCVIVPGAESDTRWKCRRDTYLDNLFGVPDSKGLPWVASLARTTRGPATFSTFLLTHGADGLDANAIKAKYLGGKPSPWFEWQPEGISANALDLGAHGSILIAACPYGKKLESAEMSTDAELAVVLLSPEGKVRDWALAKGGNLSARGKKLVSGKAREFASAS